MNIKKIVKINYKWIKIFYFIVIFVIKRIIKIRLKICVDDRNIQFHHLLKSFQSTFNDNKWGIIKKTTK